MNETQLRKVAAFAAKMGPVHAQSTGAMAQGAQDLPDDWESHLDKLIAAPGPVQVGALPSWIWTLIIQIIQMIITNLPNIIPVTPAPAPTPTPPLVTSEKPKVE